MTAATDIQIANDCDSGHSLQRMVRCEQRQTNMNEPLNQDALEHGSMMPALPKVSDADMASCYAETAKNFMQNGWWVEAYIELHHAAEICWRNGKRQRHEAPNAGTHAPRKEKL